MRSALSSVRGTSAKRLISVCAGWTSSRLGTRSPSEPTPGASSLCCSAEQPPISATPARWSAMHSGWSSRNGDLPGFQVPRPVEAVVAGITPNISALFLNQDITLGSASASIWAGSYAAHQPVDVIHSAYSAVHQSDLAENFYNRIWLIPGRLDLGNVVSVQERAVSVWNAHFTPRTMSQIDREDADGISLAGQPSPPLPFAALQERIWTVAVSTDGPPVVDARIVWQLQDEQPLILVITGNRITAWPFAPDWSDGVQESLEWLTELLTSTSGVEQRRSLRLSPRRSFEAEFYAEGRERVLLDLSLAGWADESGRCRCGRTYSCWQASPRPAHKRSSAIPAGGIFVLGALRCCAVSQRSSTRWWRSRI